MTGSEIDVQQMSYCLQDMEECSLAPKISHTFTGAKENQKKSHESSTNAYQ